MREDRQGRRAGRLRARRSSAALKVKVDDDTLSVVLDAVGSDIRELASACSQLVADTGGHVDAVAVRRYHSGKAEVSGFDIADKAVVGDVAGSTEALRWAMMRGVPHVVLADALAEAIHAIARVGPLSGDPYRLASELGMPPWRIQKAQKQSRRWSRDKVATAIRVVAALNADVKGAAADADYALEDAVRKVAELAAGDAAGTGQILLKACDESRLLVGGLVLVNHALAGGLVQLAAGRDQQFAGLVLVALGGGLTERADRGMKRGLHRLVAQSAALVGENPLLLRLDVGHAYISSSFQARGVCHAGAVRPSGSDCQVTSEGPNRPKCSLSNLPKRRSWCSM